MTLPRLHTFPFSRRGSWINFYRKKSGSRNAGDPAAPLCLRVVAGTLWEEAEIFDLDLERQRLPVPWSEEVSPGLLVLRESGGEGLIRIAFQDEDTVRFSMEAVDLRLDLRRGRPLRLGETGWGVRAGSCSWLLLSASTGNLTAEKDPAIGEKNEGWALCLKNESGAAELLVHRTASGGTLPSRRGSLNDCASAAQADFEAWSHRFTPVPTEFSDLRHRELWNIWNLIVHPLGNFRREVVLVSKGFLVGLWSWDHCWHLLGTAGIDSELSWNSFMAVFDHQDEQGALPDVVCANQLLWTVLKPPVHGWMLGILEARHSWFGDEHRLEIYPGIARMTRFWLRERDEDQDGIPHYLDGCDCGWDNATVFDRGFPMETPDLATWLILQQEWLARTARRLGLEEQAVQWEEGARQMLVKLLEHFWTGDRFVGRMSGTHEAVPSESLLLRIPLLLGGRLPEAARRWCLEGVLEGGCYRTAFGLLTEPKESPLFEGDGYWRGPMWPVAVFIFVEALRVNKLELESFTLARDYLRHVASVGNFENYRGDTGEGVRDSSIAWTSTCVLSFLADLADRAVDPGKAPIPCNPALI
jgi:putative isomerase